VIRESARFGQQVVQNLRSDLMRALLILGVISIAGGSLVVFSGLHAGIRKRIHAVLTVTIHPNEGFIGYFNPSRTDAHDVPPNERLADLNNLKDHFRGKILFAGLAWSSQAMAQYGGTVYRCKIMAAEPTYSRIRGWTFLKGRAPSQDDEAGCSRVCILTEKTSHALFGNSDPVGKALTVDKVPFEVVGVRPDEPELLGPGIGLNDYIFIPFSTGMKRLWGLDGPTVIRFGIINEEEAPSLLRELRQLLSERHPTPSNAAPLVDVTFSSDYIKRIQANKRSMYFSALATSLISVLASFALFAIVLRHWLAGRKAEHLLKLSVGASASQLRLEMAGMFGALIVLGSALGFAMGYAACVFLERAFEMPNAERTTRFPVDLTWVSTGLPLLAYTIALFLIMLIVIRSLPTKPSRPTV
jgi:ABC-type antimicrobial peptide transport system permease subunit